MLKKILKNAKIEGEIKMKKKNESLLGYMDLETGRKLVTPMDDVFLNYIYQDEANWDHLKTITNIFYQAYIETYKDTKLKLIEGEISVKTKFPYFRNLSASKPKEQDFRIESVDKVDWTQISE